MRWNIWYCKYKATDLQIFLPNVSPLLSTCWRFTKKCCPHLSRYAVQVAIEGSRTVRYLGEAAWKWSSLWNDKAQLNKELETFTCFFNTGLHTGFVTKLCEWTTLDNVFVLEYWSFLLLLSIDIKNITKVTNLMKRVKCGIIGWECAEVSRSFICDCLQKKEVLFHYPVVIDLTSTLTAKNHHTLCDKFPPVSDLLKAS